MWLETGAGGSKGCWWLDMGCCGCKTGAGRSKTDAVASKWVPVAQNGPCESTWVLVSRNGTGGSKRGADESTWVLVSQNGSW